MIKDLLKKLLYATANFRLDEEIIVNLGYCFHTEHIYNKKTFETLISFCKLYFQITNSKPVCTVMTPPNPRVMKGMKEHHCSNEIYVERVTQLSTYAHIGFHGHFWGDPQQFHNSKFDIKGNNKNYELFSLREQFQSQVNWFRENNLDHNQTYAAGWWFINNDILKLLSEEGIRFDYSFSKSIHFRNPYSFELMQKNNIKCGEPFNTIHHAHHKILHIQNFIGCHTSPYFEDFVRNFNKITDADYFNLYGVVNSHDYDLQYDYTVSCIEKLAALKNIRFQSHKEMTEAAAIKTTKEIQV
jgi:hypothetical protein